MRTFITVGTLLALTGAPAFGQAPARAGDGERLLPAAQTRVRFWSRFPAPAWYMGRIGWTLDEGGRCPVVTSDADSVGYLIGAVDTLQVADSIGGGGVRVYRSLDLVPVKAKYRTC